MTKKLSGLVDGASTSFTFDVDCPGTAHDQSLVVAVTNGTSATGTTTQIPTGLTCTVTERSTPGWTQTGVVPAGGVVAVGSTVTFTNTRTTGAISVTKVVSGPVGGASTSFTFDVDCPGTAHDQSLVVAVTSGTSATSTTKQIPTGLTCTVTERATPDWRQTSVVPAGGVVAVGSTVTFTNQRRQGALQIGKEVSPVAGNGVVVEAGDTLTYTLTVTATGDLQQPNVVVTDYVPGFDPARPASGSTTYVPGSAKCVGAGVCTVTGPGADGLITWQLGHMDGGTSRQVTFQVVIDELDVEPGETVVEDILNAAAVQSDR
ncbi:MAG: DUF5979 domain-containing protein, partial [Actinomycetes bacterium]